MSVYSEIKKYLLYLVGFFCVVLSVHIVILYLYNDAETYALNGGTLNIGIIGKKPALDILSVDTKMDNNPNDTVFHFLYRGLLRYSTAEKKIVGDLGKCGLDTFPTIRCTLTQNALWSDGTAVTTDDIISTYEFFRENAHNESMKSRLALVDVQEDRGDAVFRFKTNDATILDTLFLPILNKKDIARSDTTTGIEQNIFSGPYVFDSIDTNKGTFLLKQNPYFKDAEMVQYFDQVRLGFGETQEALDKSIDGDIILSDVPPKGKKTTPYIRPILYGIFLNSARLANPLRKAITNDILLSLNLSNISDASFRHEDNIFLGEVPSETKKTVEDIFTKTATSLGYYFGGTAPVNPVITTPKSSEKPLKYITHPGKVSPIFSSADTVEISGTTPRGTTRVVINDYTLQNFVARSKQFLYNAKKDYKNLTDGVNNYRVSFYSGKKLLAQESLTFYYNSDKDELEKLRAEWQKGSEPEPQPVEPAPANLDPKKLYKDGKPLTMTIVIQNEVPFFPQMAEQIKEKLTTFGVTAEIIALPIAEIKKNIQDPDFSYDIVLSGINLGLFHYNILPFFHSGQVKEGYNISRLRNSTLDSIMERMTEQLYYGSPDKLRNYETNAEKILEQEAVFTPLAAPYEYIFSKKTVLGLSIPGFLPGRESLIDVLSKSYLKQGYRLSKEPKTISGFFAWLKNELFSNL